jgi:4-amino-4-deoxy-L-arabinose transferase-like glycosyltransferase
VRLDVRRWDHLALAAVALGALVRALWVFVLHQPFDHIYSDMGGYVSRAQKLAQGGPLFPFDASYPPGTHLLLAVPFRIFGVGATGLWAAAVLWWAFSSLAPFFMWRLARLLLTPAAAALTGLFCAVWPLHVTYAGYFSSETPSLALLSGGLWLAYRARRSAGRGEIVAHALAAGLVAGAAIAVRVLFVLNFLIAGIGMLLRRPRQIRAFAAAAAGVTVVMAGVIAHNSAAENRLAGPDGHAGLVFFIGHCDVRFVTLRGEGSFEFAPPPQLQLGRGRTYDFADRTPWDAGFFYREGLKCVQENGVNHLSILTLSLANMTATTLLWPQANEPHLRDVVTVTNFLYTLALLPIVAGALVLASRRRAAGVPSGEVTMLLHLSMLVPVAIIAAVGEPRYRTVYDLFGLALLAAIIADRFFDRRTSPKT